MKKLGPNAYPFMFTFPPNAPCSVTLQPGDDETAKPLGVEYNVKTYVAESPDATSHKRSSVSLTIKKVYFPQANRRKTIILRLKQVKLSL
jgi:secreted Zn-dependent insulinase-like peptidase